MKILALDTSVGVSVAVLDGEQVLAQFTDAAHGIQGEQTSAQIKLLLNQCGLSVHDITKVVVGVGPGPFTGLRVGIATAQAFALARGISVVGLSSLDAIAYEFGKPCIVVTDARRKELYWAKYDPKRILGPSVSTPQQLAKEQAASIFVGPAANLYPEIINGQVMPLNAAALGKLFAAGNAEVLPVTPLYLRKPDAQEPTSRKSVL